MVGSVIRRIYASCRVTRGKARSVVNINSLSLKQLGSVDLTKVENAKFISSFR